MLPFVPSTLFFSWRYRNRAEPMMLTPSKETRLDWVPASPESAPARRRSRTRPNVDLDVRDRHLTDLHAAVEDAACNRKLDVPNSSFDP